MIFVFILPNISFGQVYSNDVTVYVNQDEISFPDQKPFINKHDRTLVPIRFIAENMGAEVEWINDERKVIIEKRNDVIELQISQNSAKVNDNIIAFDTYPSIHGDRTMVPLRFVSETLGAKVEWDNKTRSVHIDQSSSRIAVREITIGNSQSKVKEKLGQPERKDPSPYGFEWYIYNQDYSEYTQIGVEDNKVVGLYSNATWESEDGITIGETTSAEIVKKFGEPIEKILKDDTYYMFSTDNKGRYLIDDYYATFFYDQHDNDTIFAVQLIQKDTEERFQAFYPEPCPYLKEGYEKQMQDIINASRKQTGKSELAWNEAVAKTARKHSEDMVKNNFFSHTSYDDRTLAERLKENNVDYLYAGENIATGYLCPIFAHEGLMNSYSHRQNILNDFSATGIGIAFSDVGRTYFTQNFIE